MRQYFKHICSIALFIAFAFTMNQGWGQDTYTLGSGTTKSTSEAIVPIRPNYYNHRIQYLVRASELTAAGASAGKITKLAIYVSEAPEKNMAGFNIHLGTTSDTVLSGWKSGLTNVYSATPQLASDFAADAWTTFSLSTTINWDGKSNVVVEFCFNATEYAAKGGIYVYDPGTYNCTQAVFSDDLGYGCGSTKNPSYFKTRAQMKFTIEKPPIFHNTGGSSQLAFNNSYIHDSSPIFRVSHAISAGMDAFEIEVNTAADFSGTAYKQEFTGTYSASTQYNLDCDALDNSWSPSNGTTYYVRVRASANGGTSYGAWSSGVYSFTYKTSGDTDWMQTEKKQFESATLSNLQVNASGYLEVPVTATQFGVSSVGGSTEYGVGFIFRQKVSITNPLKLSSISLYLGDVVSGSNIILGLYNDTAGSPKTLVAITDLISVTSTTGWYTGNTTTNPELAAGTYYIVVNSSKAGNKYRYNTTETKDGYYKYYGWTSPYLPSAAPTSWTNFGNLSVYLNGTSIPGTALSTLINYSSFVGASGWNQISWSETETNGNVKMQVWYDNSGTPTIVPDGSISGNSSGIASSPISISGLSTTTYSKLYLKALLTYDGGSPRLNDWTVSGSFGLDMDSKAEAPSTQVAAASIASTVDTDGEAQEVFAFKISDLGTADGEITDVSNIRIKPGGSNTADWTDHIQSVKLYDRGASSFVTIGSPTITDTYINIPIVSGNLEIADGTSKSLSLYVYLNTSNIVDNKVLQFMIDYDDPGFSAHSGGSTFAANFGAADISGNNQTIAVTATKLVATQEPSSSVCPNTNLTQAFQVKASDANGNTDLDYTSNVSVTNAGSLTMSGSTVAASSGIATFTNLQFTQDGSAGVLTTSSNLSETSSTTSITVIGTPNAPSITSADITTTSIKWYWSSVAQATSYEVSLDAGAYTSVGTDREYQKTALGINTQHSLTVKSVACGSSSAASAASSVFTAANVPAAPTVANVSPSRQSVTVNENSNPASTEFAIYNVTLSKWVQADGSLGASEAWKTDANWGTVTVSGLSQNTQYTYKVKARNGDGVETALSSQATATTPCGAETFPFFEGWESGYSHDQIIAGCYTQVAVYRTAEWRTYSSASYQGTYCAGLYHNNTRWLFFPVYLQNNISYNVSLFANSVSAATLEVKFGSSNTAVAMAAGTSVIGSTALSTVYQELTGTITAPSTGLFYVGILGTVPNGSGYARIDNISIKIKPDETSFAEEPTSQVGATSISSVSNVTEGNALKVFSFDITDAGNTDQLPTKVTNIRIKPGGSNTADWTDHLQGVKLYDNDGSSFVTIGSPTITDTYLDIPIVSGNLVIADGASKSLSLYVYLNTSNIVDSKVLQFMIDYDDPGFIAEADNSQFASEFGVANISGNNITIEVVSTELRFADQQPGSGAPINTDFTVTVRATDANGNIDLGVNTGSVTISKHAGSGTLSSVSGLSSNFVNGVAKWTDTRYNHVETCPNGLEIKATHSGAFAAIYTGCIIVATAPGDFAITTSNGVSCSGGSISVGWEASSGADTYDLYWCSTPSCNPTSGAHIVTGVSSPHSFSIPDNNTVYNIKIRANNLAASVWSSNMLTHTTNSASTWSGGTSSDWSNGANWCGGSVPSCEDDIVIMTGAANYPVLSAHALVRNLTVEAGASIGLSSYTLSVYGDLDLGNSTLNAGTGTIFLKDSGCASASGVHYVDMGSNTIHNFTLNTGTVTLVNNPLKLSGNLTITDGTLKANGQNVEIAGNWTNYSLFVPGSGSVIFNGSGNSTIIKDGPEVVLYQTGFEDSESGTAGWTLGSVPGKTEWRRQSAAVADQRLAPASGTYDLSLYSLLNSKPGYAYDGTTDHNSYVDAQKRIDLTDVNTAKLSFDWYCHGKLNYHFGGLVLANGVLVANNLFSILGQTQWRNTEVSLEPYCNSEAILTFRMFMIKYASQDFPQSPGNYGFAIDNVVITGTESAESFNNLVVAKTGSGTLSLDDATASKVNILNDFTINSGGFDAKDNRIRLYGDLVNNGTFTAGTSELIIKGEETQKISGSSNIEFYDVTLNSIGNLIIGNSLVSGFEAKVTNSFKWLDNNDKISIGVGQKATFILPGDLTIYNGCSIETANGSTVSLAGHYVNYGIYTHNDGEIKFYGNENSYIIKEPSEVLFYEGFEAGNGGFSLGDGINAWARSSGAAHQSNYDIAIKARDQYVPYDYLYSTTVAVSATKVIDLTGYEVAELQFWWRSAGESGKDYGQLLINGDTILDNLHNTTMYTLSPRIDISQYANASLTLEFKWINDNSGGNSPGFCIDDILITGTSINKETFYNLSVDKSNSKSTIIRCPIDVNNNVTITNGDLNSGGISFPVGGNWYNYNSSTFTHLNNTITFDGNEEDKNQLIYNNSLNKFYKVIINNADNDISLDNNRFYLDDDLIISAGNLKANSQDIMIEGDWVNQAGTFEASNRTVYFRGKLDQQLTSRAYPFYNMSLPAVDVPSSGYLAKENRVIMNDDIVLNNNLTLSAGALNNNSLYDIEIKGNWFNDGGDFVHPNTASTLVKFSGSSTQTVNLKADGTTVNSANFSFDNVEINGTDVRFHINTQTLLLLVGNLVINDGKTFKIIEP